MCYIYTELWREYKNLWTEVCYNQCMEKVVFSLLSLPSKIDSQTGR